MERSHGSVGDGDPDGTDPAVLAGWVHPIREKDDVQIVLRRNPE
jgi:hypothetical protein